MMSPPNDGISPTILNFELLQGMQGIKGDDDSEWDLPW